MSLPISAKLEGLSVKVRDEMLFTSGGWLGELVPMISDALGIWDTFILGALFIFAWVVLRVSDPLTSLILGLTFDVTIPLQHQLNPKLVDRHQTHLQGYWPIQAFAMGLEMLCFFMVIPELFTMIVCLKTFIMTSIWLGRRSDGSFLTERNGQRARSKSNRPERDSNLAEDPPSERPGSKNPPKSPSSPKPPSTPKPPSSPKPDPEPAESKTKDKKKNKEKWTAEDEKNLKKKYFASLPDDPGPPQDPGPGFAPPGRGPPISEEDAAKEAQEWAARRRARGRGVKPEVVQLHSAGAQRQHGSGPAGAGVEGVFPGDAEDQSLYPLANRDYRTIYINPEDPQWQFEVWRIRKANGGNVPPTKPALVAEWEKALPHDSLDLLNWYLKKMGFEKEVRGWMLLDLMCDTVHQSVLRTFKSWQDAYYQNSPGKLLTDNYQRLFRRREYGWRPVNDFWGTAEIDPRGFRADQGEMDDFIWQLREAEVGPDARTAMLRDLMSQASPNAYMELKRYLVDQTKPPHPRALITGPTKYDLIDKYQRQQNFGGFHHISAAALYAERVAQRKMNKFTEAQINDHLRIIRWSVVRDLPKNPWEHQKYLDELRYEMRAFGANIETVFGMKLHEILDHWRNGVLKAGQ